MFRSKRFGILMVVATVLLLLPLLAMQFTREVNWSLFDFATAAILLYGTVTVIELVLLKVRKPVYRLALCAVVVAALVLVWLELAVGIFGTPFSGS
jgi:hypothetical protein